MHNLMNNISKQTMLLGMTAMATVVVASNILVQFLLGNWLTWGAFVYPFAFLVTDLMNRIYGPVVARRVIAAGFLVGIGCSLVGSQIEGEFGPIVTIRIALGSGLAFLVAQLLDVSIFNRLRKSRWWKAPLLSSLFGSILDTFLFFFIAFSSQLIFLEPSNDVEWVNVHVELLGFGPLFPLWMSLAAADLLVKFLFSLVLLGPFRVLSTKQPAW